MLSGRLAGFAFCFSVLLSGAEPDLAERYYQAIRNDDLTGLRALIKDAGVAVRDSRGTTPLMAAAAVGSADAMKLLLGAGAEVNARNDFDATALMWCATDKTKVEMLLKAGADVNAKSKLGRTPLFIAASSNGTAAIVRMLLEKGADLKTAAVNPADTPLSTAAQAGDSATVRLLIAHGAPLNGFDAKIALLNAALVDNLEIIQSLVEAGGDVNFVSPPVTITVKNGPVALGKFTPLLVAAAYGKPATLKYLLDHGANVNAQDVRGMTPLMLAIATDRVNLESIRLLLARGADPKLKSNLGETAADWAKKFNVPNVLALLDLKPAKADAVPSRTDPVKIEEALARSTALLQRATSTFFVEGGCASCHAHNLGAMAVDAVRSAGASVDAEAARQHAQQAKVMWSANAQGLLQRVDLPGDMDTTEYALFGLAAAHVPADRVTDAIIHNLAAMQKADGNWHMGGVSRPPMEDGDFSRTAMAIRGLLDYGPKGRRAEFAERIKRASDWLLRTPARSTEDRNMMLLGLKWAGADSKILERIIRRNLATQNEDGGWSQTEYLGSDAYATAQTLYALRQCGYPLDSEAVRKGVAYLLRTQQDDGSWHVRSRAAKFQPYFQGGFPYDHDQWISMSATGWATMALAATSSAQARLASGSARNTAGRTADTQAALRRD